jgi:putative serine protease PepD
VDPDDGLEDEDGPLSAWLPPDDRLWRHPSEIIAGRPGAGSGPSPPGAAASGGAQAGQPPATGSLAGGGPGPSRVFAVAVVAGLVGAMAASGFGIVSGVFQQERTIVRPVVQSSPAVSLAFSPGSGLDWSSVEDAIAPAVVSIDVSSPSGSVTGSGVLFVQGSAVTYVITDSSLLSGGGDVLVDFQWGQQVKATVINEDPLTGLALLAVPWTMGTFPNHGSLADLQPASPVLAIGAPGSGGGSAFAASVSTEDRDLQVTGGAVMQNLIAISSTSIPPAATGGPLVDEAGRIVGITVNVNPVNSSDESLSYAVPVDVADHVASQMIAGAPVTHPWLGVTQASDLSSSVSQQLGLQGGAAINAVSPGSPASKMGLTSQDIVTRINGFRVVSAGSLVNLLETKCHPNQTVPIDFLHDGQPMQARVFVSSQPDDD